MRWFKPIRHSYLPVSLAGALTYIPFIAYLFFATYLPLKDLRPYSLDYLVILPNWFMAGYVMTLLAKEKSK